MLSKCLNKLIPLFRILEQFFDLNKLLSSEGAAPLSSQLVREVAGVTRIEFFVEHCELMRVFGISLEKFAHRLEGCMCHAAIWTLQAGRKRKQSLIQEATGAPTCFWKGKTGAYMAATGLDELCDMVNRATTEELQSMLDRTTDAPKRAALLGHQAQLRTSLIATLSAKLGFWKAGVYRALGGFWGELGGDLALARRRVGEAIAEFDEALRTGAGARLHRVFRAMFGAGTRERLELRRFADGHGASLRDFPHAFLILQKYAMCNVTERRIEQLHSLINQLGKKMKHVLPPYLCSRLREEYNMQLLRNDRDFHDLCVRERRRKNLHATILRLRLDPDIVRHMTPAARIRRIYQCSAEDEYADTAPEREATAAWNAATVQLRSAPEPTTPEQWKLSVSYFKHVWRVGDYYSLPTSLFQAATRILHAEERQGAYAMTDPVAGGLIAVDDPPSAGPEGREGSSFFVVKHLKPEDRAAVHLYHLAQTRTSIHVCTCTWVGGPEGMSFSIDGGQFVALDATVLAIHMRAVLGCMFRWTPIRRQAEYEVAFCAPDDVLALGLEPLSSSMSATVLAPAMSSSSSSIAGASVAGDGCCESVFWPRQ